MCLAAHSQYFSPVTIYICPLIHNILCPLSSPVKIVDSIFLPVEVNNSTIELYLPVDSQYSSPVEALNLIIEPKPLPVEVNNSTIALSYICPSRRYRVRTRLTC